MDGPGIPVAVATVADYGARSGAEHVAVVLDRGETHEPIVLQWAPGTLVAVTVGEGEPDEVAPDPGVAPAPLPSLRAIPATALHPEPESGRIMGPIGAMSHLAEGLLALARALGGRSVATADFPTHVPGLPITLAARDGDPVIVELAGNQFELPDDTV